MATDDATERMASETSDPASRVAELLGGRSLACAESCTAGRVSAELAAVGGAVDWLRGGLVAYQTATKRRLLGVRAPSVVSEQAAREMAMGVARLLEADVALSTTGVIGDTPSDGVAPGTVVIATAVGDDVRVRTRHFEGEPDEVCEGATQAALAALAEHLETADARRGVA
jgi:nicotinamide-nucleotide amidase